MRSLKLLADILLLIIAFFAPMFTFTYLFEVFGLEMNSCVGYTVLYDFLSLIFVILGVYILKRVIDKKQWNEIGLSEKTFNIKYALFVCCLVLAVYAIGFGVNIISGSFAVDSFQWSGIDFFISIISFGIWASIEEIVFRGYLITRLMNANIKSWNAVVVGAVVFAAAHCINPSFNILAMINIFLTGILLGGIFIYTKNLYYPILFHWLWNWIQGPLLGFSVSGCDMFKTITTLTIEKDNLMNGGQFGFEASLVCTILLIMSIVAVVRYFTKSKN